MITDPLGFSNIILLYIEYIHYSLPYNSSSSPLNKNASILVNRLAPNTRSKTVASLPKKTLREFVQKNPKNNVSGARHLKPFLSHLLTMYLQDSGRLREGEFVVLFQAPFPEGKTNLSP